MNLILSFIALLPVVFSADWHYSGEYGPDNWGKINKDCDLPYQSPINIMKEEAEYNHEFPKFEFNNYDHYDGKFLIMNNGHTIGALTPLNISLTGGGLPSDYLVAQFHFHWGGNGSRGSEHLVDGKSYAGELHIVHHADHHGHLVEALDKEEGLAVLGVFLTIGEHNGAYERFFKHLQKATFKGDSIEIPGFPLQGFLPKDLSEFWRYSGSLTTPPCHESVLWTVFQNPVEISQEQMDSFRSLMFTAEDDNVTEQMHDNYRPIQPLAGRKVYNCKTNDTEEEAYYIFEGEGEGDEDEEDNHVIHWEYKGKYGPAHWGEYYPECKKQQQSPINIIPKSCVYKPDLEPFQFNGYSETPTQEYLVLNNGHTLGSILPLTHNVKGGGLPTQYVADQFHFHWGLNDTKGSEHLVDGESYPLEMHIVHHSNKYATLNEAIDKYDGLAVLGVFFKIGKFNQAFDDFKKYLGNVTFNDDKVHVEAFPLDSLMPSNRSGFFRYRGSLTTPPCYESVIWTVFQEAVEISSGQLEAFRLLKKNIRSANDTTPIAPDYRPVQPLGDRVVYSSLPLPLVGGSDGAGGSDGDGGSAGDGGSDGSNGSGKLATSVAIMLSALLLSEVLS